MNRWSSVALVALLLVLVVGTPSAKAHQMYNGLLWHNAPHSTILNHKVIYLATNGDNLGTTVSGQMPNMRSKWNAFSDNYVSAFNSPFGSSDADYATYNNSWPSAWFGLEAITLVYDANYNDYISGYFTGFQIYYAQVYLKSSVSSSDALLLLVHETGHIMNLGHPPSGTASVMRLPVIYDTPQDHDRSDLKIYYS